MGDFLSLQTVWCRNLTKMLKRSDARFICGLRSFFKKCFLHIKLCSCWVLKMLTNVWFINLPKQEQVLNVCLVIKY